MSDMPKFWKGMQPGDMVASEMQNQSDVAQAVANFTVTPPLKLTRGYKTLVLSIDPTRIPSPQPERTVVITAIQTHTLSVQPVRYKALPPLQCVGDEPDPQCGIELVEQPFTAYPEFGKKPSDYTSMKFTAPISSTTQYARCSYEYGVWIVQMPSGGAGSATIPVSIVGTTATMLRVQPLKWTENGTALEDDGEVVDAKPWPDRSGTDWVRFVGKSDVFAMFNLAGKLCVMHHLRHPMIQPPAGTVFGGCP